MIPPAARSALVVAVVSVSVLTAGLAPATAAVAGIGMADGKTIEPGPATTGIDDAPGANGVSDANDPLDANASSAPGPRIVELYPNPVAEGNRGEYLVVRIPGPGNWSLSDGHHDASLPAGTNGTVAFSAEPELARSHLDGVGVRVRSLDAHFPLSASGDRIELRDGDEAVDVVDYGRVREGYRWRVEWGEWRPRGYEPRAPERTADAMVTPFVLPDSPETPVGPLETTEDRLFVAGYTIESERVADRLVAAAERGVTVRVLIEGSPVGGFPRRGAHVADRLVAAGVEVRVLAGEPGRFRFHHAKYAVADDRAVVLTENWKAAGTGGRSSRGWGVVAADPAVAADIAALFANDATGHDTLSWRAFRADATVHGSGAAGTNDAERRPYPSRFDPLVETPADVELLTAPGNAANRLVERIDAADDRVLAIVPRTGGPAGRIVRALRRAADRGVDTHLLVSNAWYDREENRLLVESLADEPIDVAVAEPRGRYGKVHAKGLVIDDTAVVGSLNWNEGAATENREVLLAVESGDVADFYARTYAADWRGGGVHLPVGLLAGLLATLAGAGVVARREVAFVR